MEVVTKPKVTRFAQTQPGDLFMYPHPGGLSLAMSVTDPANDGDRVAVIIGPVFPQGTTRPTIVTPPGTTVISFGKNYTLRLPSQVKGWLTTEPSDDVNCIVVTDQGTFIRANYGALDEFRSCYIDMESGEIQTDKNARAYIVPLGIRAFAIEWELLTAEKDMRSILSYPMQQASSEGSADGQRPS
jgi:hypothetical protein